MIRVYMSHSIRGKKGKSATAEDMENNNKKATIFGRLLKKRFPKLGVYVPADHDEFVLIAYLKKYLTEKQILDVDCAIVQRCSFLLVYSPDGYISKGMRVEMDYAIKSGIPVIQIKNLKKGSIELLNRQLLSFMK